MHVNYILNTELPLHVMPFYPRVIIYVHLNYYKYNYFKVTHLQGRKTPFSMILLDQCGLLLAAQFRFQDDFRTCKFAPHDHMS